LKSGNSNLRDLYTDLGLPIQCNNANVANIKSAQIQFHSTSSFRQQNNINLRQEALYHKLIASLPVQ